MLVLDRNYSQKIVIGDNEIVITVLRVSHGRVRLGIDAPKGMPVHREEVYKKITEQGGSIHAKRDN